MPRDATETRARLLEAAESLFATKGIYGTTSREIIAAADQRNASALTYHFGSRSGILLEILRRYGDPLDDQRGRLAPDPIEDQETRELVAALLVPYVGCLSTREGRNYLRIVAQLSDQFAGWREVGVSAVNLNRILDALESRVPADPPIRRQRVVSAITLMTALVSERARHIDDPASDRRSGTHRNGHFGSHSAELGDDRFVANLADVIVAVLEAPVGPPLRPGLPGFPGPTGAAGISPG